MKLSRRIIANARLLAEVAAAQVDGSMADALNAQARKMGYRSWSRLMNVFKEKHNDSGVQRG